MSELLLSTFRLKCSVTLPQQGALGLQPLCSQTVSSLQLLPLTVMMKSTSGDAWTSVLLHTPSSSVCRSYHKPPHTFLKELTIYRAVGSG